MALEDRCSPSSAATPGPKASSDRPGSDGNAVCVTSPVASAKNEKSRQICAGSVDESYDLSRTIKVEPDMEMDTYEEKKTTRIWRKISEEDDSKSSSSEVERRLSPGYDKVVKTSLPPEIIHRFSSYSIERFVNSDAGENSIENGVHQHHHPGNGQYPMDVTPANYLNVPLFMSKTHKNISMLGVSHQKVTRTMENGRLASSVVEKKSPKHVDSSEEETAENNNNNNNNNDGNSNGNNNSSNHSNSNNNNDGNESRIKFSVEDILKPDFGSKYIQKNSGIWNPLKRTVTPIIRTGDELRKPNRIVQNRTNRGFDIARLTEVESPRACPPQEDFAKRRNSDALPSAKTSSKLQERRKTTDAEGLRLLPDVTVPKDSPTRIPLPSPAASSSSEGDQSIGGKGTELWPAWVYCTRYSDRPSSGEFLFFCGFVEVAYVPPVHPGHQGLSLSYLPSYRCRPTTATSTRVTHRVH
ncbi:hypothetical protein RUM44_006535 [Polyplax serrata]|uniref:Uncharacterized protein n=1 Tax=Polyplax serrata TaxID=468196 RepID=A0ABR1AIC8_POLSC